MQSPQRCPEQTQGRQRVIHYRAFDEGCHQQSPAIVRDNNGAIFCANQPFCRVLVLLKEREYSYKRLDVIFALRWIRPQNPPRLFDAIQMLARLAIEWL